MSGNSNQPTPDQSENLPKRSECECECHSEGNTSTHETPCCSPDETSTDGKDGKDYF